MVGKPAMHDPGHGTLMVRTGHASLPRTRHVCRSCDVCPCPLPERVAPLLPDSLGQRFTKLARAAGLPRASLHRLRHTVGTYLVSEGKIVQATQRLRHRDAATTLREYVHAVDPDDKEIADLLARLYRQGQP